MLLDDCENLELLAQKISQLKNNNKNLSIFQKKYEQIHLLVDMLRPTFSAFQVFRKRGIGSFSLNQAADKLISIVSSIQSEFQKDPSWLTDPQRFKIVMLQNTVKNLNETAHQQLADEWKQYRDSKLRSNDEFLNVFERLEYSKSSIQKIRKLTVEVCSVTYPTDEKHFQEVDNKLIEIQKEWGELNPDSFPDEVRNFLKAAEKNVATITMLTPQVIAWLNEQRMTDLFRIGRR